MISRNRSTPPDSSAKPRVEGKLSEALKWIAARFGRGNPLARQLRSPKALQKFMEGLKALEPARALRAITAVFDEAPSLNLEAPRLLEALDACDSYAQRLCLVVTDGLLENLPKQIVSEPAWNTLAEYQRARERGYRACLSMPETTLPGNEQAYTTSVLLACRAANALARRCVLLGMTYRAPGSEVWAHVAQLADECRVAARSVALTTLYRGDLEQTSIEQELLVTLMFESAPIANLLPTQHHALELLLRRHARHFEIRDSFDVSARPFVIEGGRNGRPARWLQGRKERPGLRFFGPGYAGSELLKERIQATGLRKIPDYLAPSRVTLPLYRDLLARLVEHWSLAPPTRRHRRVRGDGQILVARNFAHIHRLLGFSEMARSGRPPVDASMSGYAVEIALRAGNPTEQRPPASPPAARSAGEALATLQSYEDALGRDATEPWTLIDSSDEGVGAETPSRGPRLRVGLLIALRRPDGIDWELGIVRRLNRGESAKMRIGLEVMQGRPYPARLSLSRPAAGAEPTLGPALEYDAIKLVADATYLLVPPGVLGSGWHYRLMAERRWDFIRFKQQIETGLDFERAEYSIAQAG